MAGTCIGEALIRAGRDLTYVSDSASADVQVLLAEMMGRPRAWLLAHRGDPIPNEVGGPFDAAVQRLASGEPLPYVLGKWEFFGRSFLVTPDVLIPRPETELLVEEALRAIDAQPLLRRVIDVGTGSGCIGVTVALERPEASVVATDISRGALRVARENAGRLGAGGQVALVETDLAAGVSLDDSLLIANLPYVAASDMSGLRREPRLALDGGIQGLDVLLRLLQQLAARRPQRTTVILEIGAGQGSQTAAAARTLCRPSRLWLRPDLAERDRVLGFEI